LLQFGSFGEEEVLKFKLQETHHRDLARFVCNLQQSVDNHPIMTTCPRRAGRVPGHQLLDDVTVLQCWRILPTTPTLLQNRRSVWSYPFIVHTQFILLPPKLEHSACDRKLLTELGRGLSGVSKIRQSPPLLDILREESPSTSIPVWADEKLSACSARKARGAC
jgi:hypothetical protein